MPASLLDYATSPALLPPPLPPQDTRRRLRRDGFPVLGGWPADLLPGPEIAADLVERGVTFRVGVGYALNGAQREPDQIARLVPDLLDEVADTLPTEAAKEWEHYFDAVLPAIQDNAYERLAEGHKEGTLSDENAAEVYRLLLGAWEDEDDRNLERLEALPAVDARHRADAYALRVTAAEFRVSLAARRRLLGIVRPHLAELTAETTEDEQAAVCWLAAFDRRTTVRRSELAALYAEADSPGALPPARLRALAAERWGEPRYLKGHPTHRPALASPPPATLPAAPPEDRRPLRRDSVENRAAALEYARGMAALDGEPPSAERLTGWNLSPAVAAAVYAEARLPTHPKKVRSA